MRDHRLLGIAVSLVVVVATASCAVGPDYSRPAVETPEAFKESRGWAVAQPADLAPRGKWWRVYADPDLDALEDAADGNQTVAAAEASYRAALALVDAARANYFPVVSAGANATRSGSGNGRISSNFSSSTSGSISTNRQVSLSVSWEIDLWGRVRRQVEAQRAMAEASAADLAGMKLSVQAAIASDYFQLRQLDTQRQLLDDTIAAYQRTLEVTRNRYVGGVAARVDVAQAETQLKNTQVQAIDVGTARAQFEHAIALLVGKPASSFSIPATRWTAFDDKRAPTVPLTGMPSQLLERRPDIAAAERRVVAANAQIGVAKAAYFPTLGLSASGGYSAVAGELLTLPNRFWSLGPALAQTISDGGLRRAETAQAVANYDVDVAAYRQTVLSGFAEVEDQLAALRILEQEGAAQDDALASARESLALTINQYKAGTVSYINVVATQATAYSSERNAVSIFGSRMVASVSLIRAIGGGWTSGGETAR